VKRTAFSVEMISAVSKQTVAGVTPAELIQRVGVSEHLSDFSDQARWLNLITPREFSPDESMRLTTCTLTKA
jgi:hypothetical protein